jgi:hypothetical protein
MSNEMYGSREKIPDVGLPTVRTTQDPSQKLSRKPLVDYCTNDWRKAGQYEPSSDPSSQAWDNLLDKLEGFLERVLVVVTAPNLEGFCYLSRLLFFFPSFCGRECCRHSWRRKGRHGSP